MSVIATNELLLACSIEAQSEYQPGQPVTVKGTLHNMGPTAVWILSWNTFLEPTWQHCLTVTHNGAPVRFIGEATSRGLPTQEAYIRISSGESLSREIDIRENYDVTDPGEYQVAFYLPITGTFEVEAGQWPQAQSDYMPALVESETVTFTLAGEIMPRLSLEQYKPGPLLDRIDVNAFPPEPVSAQFI